MLSLASFKKMTDNDLLQVEQKSLRDTLKWWNWVRWLSTISFLSIGIILMTLKGEDFPKSSFLLILVAITLLNIVYSLWLKNFNGIQYYPYLHNLLDIIIFSLAIHISGGLHSPLIWSYLIPVLTSSITIGRLAGFVAGFLSIVALLAVTALENITGASQAAYFYDLISQLPAVKVYILLSYACLFFLVYFISSFLAATLRKQNKALEDLNILLNNKNKQLVESQQKILQMERKAIVDRIARTIQHELNNPLAILSLNAEVLLREEHGRIQDKVKPMWNAVMRMKKIMAKIERLYSYTYRDALEDIKILDLYKSKTEKQHD